MYYIILIHIISLSHYSISQHVVIVYPNSITVTDPPEAPCPSWSWRGGWVRSSAQPRPGDPGAGRWPYWWPRSQGFRLHECAPRLMILTESFALSRPGLIRADARVILDRNLVTKYEGVPRCWVVKVTKSSQLPQLLTSCFIMFYLN